MPELLDKVCTARLGPPMVSGRITDTWRPIKADKSGLTLVRHDVLDGAHECLLVLGSLQPSCRQFLASVHQLTLASRPKGAYSMRPLVCQLRVESQRVVDSLDAATPGETSTNVGVNNVHVEP